jgi:dimeric dUTPase (all-alpha-NTP-PPase superfamily)
MDKLNAVVEMQRRLMARLGGQVLDPQNEGLIQKQTKDMLFALCWEVGEAAEEINWKPWKRTVKPVNLANLRTELIDIFHFSLELLLMWGLTAEDLFTCYEKKMAENHARQDRGY